jgi:hypothetical protein
MRRAAYEQRSHPESDIAKLISEVLAMLECSSMGGTSVQTAMSLISVTILS